MRAIFITLLLLMSSTAYADDRAELTALLA